MDMIPEMFSAHILDLTLVSLIMHMVAHHQFNQTHFKF